MRVSACNFERSFSFDTTVEITDHEQFASVQHVLDDLVGMIRLELRQDFSIRKPTFIWGLGNHSAS